MSPLAWMFIAGWCARSLLKKPSANETIAALSNLALVAAVAFCLWKGLR